ncbi:MAG: DUF5915 domain-containing protein, partial [Thermoplasmata archaeon]|nr:DUF5915 domain-containing protein [Thermoplasmata archaeon]
REELNVRELRYDLPGSGPATAEAEWVVRSLPGGLTSRLSRTPTPELRREGLLREALRRLQSARKEARLRYTDRIHLRVWADAGLFAVLEPERARLSEELLADQLELREGAPPEGAPGLRWSIEGMALAAQLEPV